MKLVPVSSVVGRCLSKALEFVGICILNSCTAVVVATSPLSPTTEWEKTFITEGVDRCKYWAFELLSQVRLKFNTIHLLSLARLQLSISWIIAMSLCFLLLWLPPPNFFDDTMFVECILAILFLYMIMRLLWHASLAASISPNKFLYSKLLRDLMVFEREFEINGKYFICFVLFVFFFFFLVKKKKKAMTALPQFIFPAPSLYYF